VAARRKLYAKQFREDFAYWRATNQKISKKIERLIEESAQDPIRGIGKPEPLRHQLSDGWSRRINQEHRLDLSLVPL
jgi:toxin YoeB